MFITIATSSPALNRATDIFIQTEMRLPIDSQLHPLSVAEVPSEHLALLIFYLTGDRKHFKLLRLPNIKFAQIRQKEEAQVIGPYTSS